MSIFKRDNNEQTESADNTTDDNVQPPTTSEKVSSDDTKPQTKMDKARIVFSEMYGKEGIKRKHIIEKFISEIILKRSKNQRHTNARQKYFLPKRQHK